MSGRTVTEIKEALVKEALVRHRIKIEEMKTMEEQAALEKSILHWTKILNGVPGEEPDSKQCALCELYLDAYNRVQVHCEGCIIYKDTSYKYCRDTPYHVADLTWYRLRKYKIKARPNNSSAYLDRIKSMRAAAQEEIDYLKSLRSKSYQEVANQE